MGVGSYQNLDICTLSLSFAILLSWGSPYMPFWISIYKKPLCAKFLRFYCWMIFSWIMSIGSFIYSYMSIGLLREKLAMYECMIFSFFVDNTLLKISLAVIRFAVDVVTSPDKLIKFTPTVSLVRCVSAFCSRISSKLIP